MALSSGYQKKQTTTTPDPTPVPGSSPSVSPFFASDEVLNDVSKMSADVANGTLVYDPILGRYLKKGVIYDSAHDVLIIGGVAYDCKTAETTGKIELSKWQPTVVNVEIAPPFQDPTKTILTKEGIYVNAIDAAMIAYGQLFYVKTDNPENDRYLPKGWTYDFVNKKFMLNGVAQDM